LQRDVLAALRLCLCVLAASALAAVPAHAQSLPGVGSGARPGPAPLYAEPAAAPQLAVSAPFAADPLLVSGTDAYRDGEYLYQDHIYDDRGADTRPASSPSLDSLSSPPAGDVRYPTAERYAGNAADLLEFRMTLLDDEIVYRVALNSVREADTAVVGIGIDLGCDGTAARPWPRGAGISSAGLDKFITAWGTGGAVTSFDQVGTPERPLEAGAVTIDTTTNQMTIRVPRAGALEPFRPAANGTDWCHVAGTGLWDATTQAWKPVPAGTQPGPETPASGNPVLDAPAVFNLAFRFDEPATKMPTAPYTTFPGIGSWAEDDQARALRERSTGRDFRARVDMAKLRDDADAWVNAPGRVQIRLFSSSIEPFEGVRSAYPQFGGRLQPYLLVVPEERDPAEPAGLTLALHSLGGNHLQYRIYSPTQLQQFGDERDSLVITPLSRSQSGFYRNESELDVFEVWADVARHFALDPERVAITGYSMGGYGTYKLAANYPDLFGSAFTAVGPPSSGSEPTGPLLENVRWVPFLNWAQAVDELVPYPGPRAQQNRFSALGLRSQLWTFPAGGHLSLAIADEWGPARDHLGAARVVRDPWRVDYVFAPANDRPALGLVHDHAYWISGLRARAAEQAADRGRVSARSLAFATGDPQTQPVSGAGALTPGVNLPDGTAVPAPNPYAFDGVSWGATAPAAPQNALEVDLANTAAARVDGRRARLAGDRALRVRVTADGPGSLELDLALPAGATARRVDGSETRPAPEVQVRREGATVTVAEGTREYLIAPPQPPSPAPDPPVGPPEPPVDPPAAPPADQSGGAPGTDAARPGPEPAPPGAQGTTPAGGTAGSSEGRPALAPSCASHGASPGP
jgi:dienelactone hydrolase